MFASEKNVSVSLFTIACERRHISGCRLSNTTECVAFPSTFSASTFFKSLRRTTDKPILDKDLTCSLIEFTRGENAQRDPKKR